LSCLLCLTWLATDSKWSTHAKQFFLKLGRDMYASGSNWFWAQK
jgi:hypothetical protein